MRNEQHYSDKIELPLLGKPWPFSGRLFIPTWGRLPFFSDSPVIRIKDWDKLQHYKDRNPPWIKIYRHLLDPDKQPGFCALPDEQKWVFVGLCLLAPALANNLPEEAIILCNLLNLNGTTPDLEALSQAGLIEFQGGSASKPASAYREERVQREESIYQPEKPLLPIAKESHPEKSSEKHARAKQIREVFELWQSKPHLVTHRTAAASPPMVKAIQARLADGYEVRDLKAAIIRLNDLTGQKRAPGHNQWGLAEFMSRGSGAWIDKMLDSNYRGISRNEPTDPRDQIAAQVERLTRES